MPTPAERKAADKYIKEHIRVFRLKLNDRTDADMIEHLNNKENMTAYIKALIRKDMEQSGCEYCTGEASLYQQSSAGELHLGTFGDNRTLEFTYKACPPHAVCCFKDIKHKNAFVIKNCPNCGRKL